MVNARSPRSIVVCVDGSNASNEALRWACEKLISEEDHLILLNVSCIDDDDLGDEYNIVDIDANMIAPISSEGINKASQKAMNKSELFVNNKMKEVMKMVSTTVNITGEVLTQSGPIGETIAKWIQHENAKRDDDAKLTMLVVGSRGIGAFKRAIMSTVGLGSASSYLTTHLTIPVIVTRE